MNQDQLGHLIDIDVLRLDRSLRSPEMIWEVRQEPVCFAADRSRRFMSANRNTAGWRYRTDEIEVKF